MFNRALSLFFAPEPSKRYLEGECAKRGGGRGTALGSPWRRAASEASVENRGFLKIKYLDSLLRGILLWRGNWMLVPHMPWRGNYSRLDFVRDLSAGITVAAVLVPQSMAYALLAGLPPVHGLYAALVGGIAGSLWGSSRHLATGPIAIVSLLTLTAVAPLAPPGSAEFIALVAALVLMVGGIQILLGLARLGFLIRLVPQSVLVGFSSAAALVIIVTQISHLFGFSVSQEAFVFEQIAHVIRGISGSNIVSVFVGCIPLVALFLVRRAYPRFSMAIFVLALGIIGSYWLDLGAYGVTLAGTIPSRLPITDIPMLSADVLLALGGKALVIALVGFMSSYAVVKEMSSKTKERVDSDQELVGQGFANVFAGLFRGYPVGGSLSRTAVNYEAGAATAWSGVFASVIVVLAILFLAPILAYLPNAILAAIVIAAVVPLIDIANLRRMYAIAHTDGVIGGFTFCMVFLLRPDEAVLAGVALALALYMRKVIWVHVVEVGIHPRWQTMNALESNPDVTTYPRTLMLRIDAPLFYANVERLKLEIKNRLYEREAQLKEPVEILILNFSGVNHMDVTGVDGFTELVTELRARGIKIYLIYTKQKVRETLERGGSIEYVRLLHNIRELLALVEHMESGSSKNMLVV